MSENPKSNFHKSTTTFVSEIRKERNRGMAFAPFLGSGISSPSGIMMGMQFTDYLIFTVWSVIHSPESTNDTKTKKAAWNLIEDGWPPYPTVKEIEEAKSFFVEWFRISSENKQTLLAFTEKNGKAKHADAEKGTRTISTNSTASSRPPQSAVRLVELSKDWMRDDPKKSAGIQKTSATRAEVSKRSPAIFTPYDLTRPAVPWELRSKALRDSRWEDELTEHRRLYGIPNDPFDPNFSRTSRSYVTEKAIRSLSHWTDTLEFLASTRLDASKPFPVFLEEPDSSVIDSFNQHITRGKQPNIIHNLLARLSRSMRSRVILTTNFDTLLEDAFTEQRELLHAIPVSIEGHLPAQATVRAQDCLIKLHGDLLETRADTTINEPPAEIDLKRFYQYLRGPASPHRAEPTNFVQSHLLVLGYSANDARCVQMIKYALDLDMKLKIFWVCHSKEDRDRIERIFFDYIRSTCDAVDEAVPEFRFHVVVSDRTDLLLWELYQALNLSLPGGGYHFKFTHLVPPERVIKGETHDTSAPTKRKQEAFKRLFYKRTERKNFLCIDYGSGMAHPCRILFKDLSAAGIKPLWFELEDHRDPISLLWDILGAIALRHGSFLAEPVNFLPPEFVDQRPTGDSAYTDALIAALDKRLELYVARYQIKAESWAFFLYGRNGPGGCAGWSKIPNYWTEADYDMLVRIIQSLANVGFRVLYLPFGPSRHTHSKKKRKQVTKMLRNLLVEQGPLKLPPPQNLLAELRTLRAPGRHLALQKFACWLKERDTFTREANAPKLPSFENTLEHILIDFCGLGNPCANKGRSNSRVLWLYALTLFRQSRHSAAMISEAVYPCPKKFSMTREDNDELRFRLVFGPGAEELSESDEGHDKIDQMGWIPWMEETGLLLKKPGGFAWKYRDIRLALQSILGVVGPLNLAERYPPSEKEPGDATENYCVLRNLRPRIHFWIADWYFRAFHSAGHYTPLVECFYHCAQTILRIADYEPADNGTDKTEEQHFARIELCWATTCLIRRAIKQGRSCFQYWCPGLDIVRTFLDDLSPLHDSLVKLEACCPSSSSMLAEMLRIFERGGILHREIEELNRSVIAEGYAHLSKPAPGGYDWMKTSAKAEGNMEPYPTQGWNHIKPVPNDAELSNEKSASSSLETLRQWLAGILKEGESGSGAKMGSPEEACMQFEASHGEVSNEGIDFHAQLRVIRRAWTQQWDHSGADPKILFQVAWELSSRTYRMLRQAKLTFHEQSMNGYTGKWLVPSDAGENVAGRWRFICILCYHALQFCRLLPPDFERRELELRISLLSTYGLALGCLGRTSEANRRLNEAHALALHRPMENLPLQLARIHLRRSEVCVYSFLEKHVEKDKSKVNPAAWAHLDDAWTATERAEAALTRKNHSSFWWYRLSITKLSCLAALGKAFEYAKARPDSESGIEIRASLPLRRRQHPASEIKRLLMEALFSAAGDHFRELRAADYALEASRLCTANGKFEDSPVFLGVKDASGDPLYSHLLGVLNAPLTEKENLRDYQEQVRGKYGLKP